jgi:hypothetical protein
VAGAGQGPAQAVEAAQPAAAPLCAPLAILDPAAFPAHPVIDNRWLPLLPGAQRILEGTANRDGRTVSRRVVFTVTDLTKVIDGVRTVVAWDVDETDGQLQEAELAFFAQDRVGRVWNLGEYPEVYRRGEFDGAPDTWISGVAGAQAGIHMAAHIRGRPPYLQGLSPDIGFLDCAEVAHTHESTCVPAACFDNTLVTREWSPLDPDGGRQLKWHAAGIGIVRVGAVGDPEAETLALTSAQTLTRDALAAAREEALRLDRRAYRFSEVYRHTPPAEHGTREGDEP